VEVGAAGAGRCVRDEAEIGGRPWVWVCINGREQGVKQGWWNAAKLRERTILAFCVNVVDYNKAKNAALSATCVFRNICQQP